jgi:hypothetical protein
LTCFDHFRGADRFQRSLHKRFGIGAATAFIETSYIAPRRALTRPVHSRAAPLVTIFNGLQKNTAITPTALCCCNQLKKATDQVFIGEVVMRST